MNDNNMCTLDEDSNASSEKIMTITKEMEEEEEKLHQHTVEEDQKWRQEKQQVGWSYAIYCLQLSFDKI